MRGLLQNAIMALDPGYELTVVRTIDFRISVWRHPDGELCIPFDCGGGWIRLIMFGKKTEREAARVCTHRASATWVFLELSRWDDLKPIGWLPYVVGGLKEDEDNKGGPSYLQVVSSTPEDPFGLSYAAPRDMELIELGEAFAAAALRPFSSDPRLRSPLKLGTVPGQWDWFPAWRWAHSMTGDREARRISLYFRSMRESPSGANCRHNKRGEPSNYVVEA